jgi:hypothetical protein
VAESELERQERYLRDEKAAARLREQMFLDERPGERLIRVMVRFNQASEYRPQTFVRADVESVAGVGQHQSAIVLRSGAEIPVDLQYSELEQKIFRPNYSTEDPVLDLRDVTGDTAKAKQGFRSQRTPS